MGLITNVSNAVNALLGVETDQRASSGSFHNPNDPITGAMLDSLSGQNYSTNSNVRVTAETALGYAPLYQAVSMISGDCAKLPLCVMQKTTSGRARMENHPVHQRLHKRGMSNREVNAFKFRRRFMVSKLLHNNAYAYIDRAENGTVLGLYNLLPDRTTPVRYRGELVYLTDVGGKLEPLPAANIIHDEGISLDNLQGFNILKAFREDFQIALSSRRFLSKFFANHMSAGGFLQVPEGKRGESAEKVKNAIDKKFAGTGDEAFKTMVLRDGFKWHSTMVKPQEAQLQEIDEAGVCNIARMFCMHPSRLGVAKGDSYKSREESKQDYLDTTLSHHLISFEAEGQNKLLSEQEIGQGYYLAYVINALLWADAKTRAEIADRGIQTGRLSPNETRAWEDLEGYDGGDSFFRPLNLEVSGQARSVSAFRSLLADTCKRASNRLSIHAGKKNNAGKTIAEIIAEERDAITAILSPAFDAASATNPNQPSTDQAVEDWIRSAATADSTGALDAVTVAATAEAIDTLTNFQPPKRELQELA